MSLKHRISYHSRKLARMAWYNIRYRLHGWKTIAGVQIPVRLSYGYPVLRFIDNGEYESCEISIISQTLADDDKVLELGTGIGFVSAYCAKRLGNDRVVSYEGNPDLKKLIQRTYKRNKVNPEQHITILAEADGQAVFNQNKRSFLASHAGEGLSGTEVAMVPKRSLNKVIAEVKPTYLVMDIEGGEAQVFSIIDFQSIYKVQFELHPQILSESEIENIFSKLAHAGFTRNDAFPFENNFYFTRDPKSLKR